MARFINPKTTLKDIQRQRHQSEENIKSLCEDLLSEATEEDLEGLEIDVNMTGEDPEKFYVSNFYKGNLCGELDGDDYKLGLEFLEYEQFEQIVKYLIKLKFEENEYIK